MSSTEEASLVFYVLDSADAHSRERFLTKLLLKIQQQQRRADVRFETQEQAERFDHIAWQQPAERYIGHSLAGHQPSRILLHGSELIKPQQDVLINLHPELYPHFERFRRTVEVLDQSPERIEAGRERWRQYKQLGLTPVVFKITAGH
ncbi:DNA polymerase III subunit chi [Thiomicrospira sp. ALE5]|uniref:DNA polymerase III subunit chi n=1 Tax=Thiomicrospira sp. ALE5 TaxID=748650 RepID=UPI0008E6F568|nr:DNA polymerase III subunit chi [Thiomicrospira sp. ALE5]SFR54441.1 DNA polymerase III, chi subunit [Thiomicrospira sp. ALE5]